MRTMTLIVVTGLAVALCGTMAAAEPSMWGFTGLLDSPTAEALGDGQYNVGIATGELEDWDDFAYYANFGLGQQTEVGVLLWRPQDGSAVNTESIRPNRNETYLSIKRSFATTDGGPTVAAGIFDITDEVETTVYVVANWQQGNVVGDVNGNQVRFLNLNAGFAAGQFEDFFGGVQLAFGTQFEILGEFINDDFNVGVRLKPVPWLNVDAGLMDVEDLAVNASYSQSF